MDKLYWGAVAIFAIGWYIEQRMYLVCCGFSVQNEASSLDDGSSTVLPVPDRLYAIIDKNDYWHSVKDSQVFE